VRISPTHNPQKGTEQMKNCPIEALRKIVKDAENIGVTYMVTSVEGGRIVDLDDAQENIEIAYDQWVESFKFWPHTDVIVWQIQGVLAHDITQYFIDTYSEVCENRDLHNIFKSNDERS
jgi:hypothetical protein